MDSIDITAIAPKIEKFVKKEGKLLSACIVPHTPTSLPSASWVMVHLLVTVRTGPVARGNGVIYSPTFVSSPSPSLFLYYTPSLYILSPTLLSCSLASVLV